MTPDASTRAVYAFCRAYRAAHRFMPDPHTVWEALGYTRREYLASLRWLERFGFLRRMRNRAYQYATVNIRRCACGVEITLENAVYGTAHRKKYVRDKCRACYNATRKQDMAAWREANPGYFARMMRRVRQNRSASA